MKGHNICFRREIRKNIFVVSSIPPPGARGRNKLTFRIMRHSYSSKYNDGMNLQSAKCFSQLLKAFRDFSLICSRVWRFDMTDATVTMISLLQAHDKMCMDFLVHWFEYSLRLICSTMLNGRERKHLNPILYNTTNVIGQSSNQTLHKRQLSTYSTTDGFQGKPLLNYAIYWSFIPSIRCYFWHCGYVTDFAFLPYHSG